MTMRPLRLFAVTGILTGAMFMSALPQFALSVAAPVLIVELAIGEALIGAVAASLYFIGAIVARGSGRLLDALSGRMALFVLGILAVLSLVSIARSTTVFMLLVGAMFGGASMGLNNPVTNRIISLHVPRGRRGIVIGFKQSGVKIAQVTAGSALPALAIAIGWRQGVIFFAALCAAIVVFGTWTVPKGRISYGIPSTESADLVRRQMRWLQYYSACMAFSVAASTTYIALFAVQRIGMDLTRAGLIVTIFGVTGMISRLIWAFIAERIGRPPLVLVTLSLGGILGLALIAATELVSATWPIWVGSALTGMTIGTWNVIAQLAIVKEVSNLHAATASGTVHAAFAIGLGTGPAVFGVIVQYSGSFLLGWGATGGMTAIGLLIAVREHRRRTAASSTGTTSASVSGS